jgi:hypothetical protein
MSQHEFPNGALEIRHDTDDISLTISFINCYFSSVAVQEKPFEKSAMRLLYLPTAVPCSTGLSVNLTRLSGDELGGHQIQRSLSTFGIHAKTSKLWDVMARSDRVELCNMISRNEALPNDRDEDGNTLLWAGSFNLRKFQTATNQF